MPSQKENPAFIAMYKQEFGLHVVWQKVSLEDLAEHENYFHGRCPDSMLAKGVKNFLDCLCESDEESARRDAVLKYGGHVARALFVSSMPETVRVACFEYMLHSRMCFKLRNNGNGFYVKALKDWLYSQTFHKYVERWIAFGTTFKVSTQTGSRKGQKRGRGGKNSAAPTAAAAAAAAAASAAASAAGSPAASPSAGVLGAAGTAASGFHGGLPNFAGVGGSTLSGVDDDDDERASRNGAGPRGPRGGRGRCGTGAGGGAKNRKRQAQDGPGPAAGIPTINIPVFGGSDNEEEHNGTAGDDHAGGHGHTPEDAAAEAETELIDSEDLGDEDAHVPLKLQVRQLKRRFVMQESTLQVLQSRFTLLERVNMQQQAIINQLVSQAVMQAKVQAELQMHAQDQPSGLAAALSKLPPTAQQQQQQQPPQPQQHFQMDLASVIKPETSGSDAKAAPTGSMSAFATPTSTLSAAQSQLQPQAQTTTEAVAALAQ